MSFEIFHPQVQKGPLVFASPHSGRDYTAELMRQSVLNGHQIRSSEDAFVDQLYADAPEFGCPLLAAKTPRAFVDFNRDFDELDPAVVQDVPTGSMNPRILSGLGVIPRVVADSRAIYRGKIPRAEADRRIDQSWRPYHAALGQLLDQTKSRFGSAVLLDCHSMPDAAVAKTVRGSPRADIILGDRFGSAAAAEITTRVEAAFQSAGFVVARNVPFSGAFIAHRYGRPRQNQHVVQIELNRALYLDEARIEPNANYVRLLGRIRSVIAKLSSGFAQNLPMAAE